MGTPAPTATEGTDPITSSPILTPRRRAGGAPVVQTVPVRWGARLVVVAALAVIEVGRRKHG